QPLIHNSEQAAVAEVISSLRGLVDELAAAPISRLTSGGISKRDVSRLAGTLDLGLEQTITLLLAAKSLRLIGVLDDALDPQRSEERRVGKGSVSQSAACHVTEKIRAQ